MAQRKKPVDGKKLSNHKVDVYVPEESETDFSGITSLTVTQTNISRYVSPDDLSAYEAIVPGSAAAILENTHKQIDAEIHENNAIAKFNLRAQKLKFADSALGQLMGFASLFGIVFASMWMLKWLVENNAPHIAYYAVLGLLGAGAFATIRKFVDGRK